LDQRLRRIRYSNVQLENRTDKPMYPKTKPEKPKL